MKKLNGNLYFQKKDVTNICDNLILALEDSNYLKLYNKHERNSVFSSIKIFKKKLLEILKEELAVKFDYIENIYLDTMHSATSLMAPEVFNQIPVEHIAPIDTIKYYNWFFNYGLALIISEFEKYD